jgi:hypothetical protein
MQTRIALIVTAVVAVAITVFFALRPASPEPGTTNETASQTLPAAATAAELPVRPEESPTSDTSAGSERRATTPLRTPIPNQYALVPGMTVPVASNWEELIAEMSPGDRLIAEELAKQYPEAYAFSSPEQLEWMLANGYPMPSEFVEASKMDQESLMQLAKSGNSKAAMLAYDRVVGDLVEQGTLLDGEPEKSARLFELQSTLRGKHCSPFPFYALARYYESASRLQTGAAQEDPLNMALAAYSVVASMGDRRVNGNSQELAAGLDLPANRVLEVAQSASRMRSTTSGNCSPSNLR